MTESLKEMVGQLSRMEWTDYLDIILVAFVIFKLLPMVRSTGATRILKVICVILVISWVTELLNLHTLNFLVDQVLSVGLIAIVVLFQPEIRRMLDHFSNMKLQAFFSAEKTQPEMAPVITQTVMACEIMSRERVGALIVFARDSILDEYTKTGTAIDGKVSDQLLRNIFFPKAALHDGAAIIQGDRVCSAGCVLPLSDSNRLHADLGTRHRAGVGITEISDAVVVIVSEETGAISVAVGGMLKRYLTPQTLDRLLRNELCPEEENKDGTFGKLKNKLLKKKEDKNNENE